MSNTVFEKKRLIFVEKLNDFWRTYGGVPNVLLDGMKYATRGGKRIRPVIVQLMADALGLPYDGAVIKLSLALEFIHSYSLVHDDLPCMDDDNLRRGELSTHKKYGEGVGVLVGDALLNLAFETAISAITDKKMAAAAAYLSTASGAKGMVGGQYLDTELTLANEEDFFAMYDGKTGGLLRSAFVIPAVLADKKLMEAEALGRYVGIIFQLTDDVLDFGKAEKNSFCDKFGIDYTKKKIMEFLHKSLMLIEQSFDGDENLTSFITDMTVRSV